MPTYEYHCEKCQQNFDAFQSMKDNAYTVCPKELCRLEQWGEGTVKRQLGTGAGLIFKGSGFYITDYRSEGYKSAAKQDSTSPKTESKPASTEKKASSGGTSSSSGGSSASTAS